MLKRMITAGICAAMGLLLLATLPATAELVRLQNDYIAATVGTSGTIQVGEDTTYDITGRWAVTSLEGDPTTDKDDGRGLVGFGTTSPAQWFGYWKVKIGSDVRIVGDSTTGRWKPATTTDPNSGVPTAYPVPRPELGLGRSGGFIEGEWEFLADGAAVASLKIKASLMRDQTRFELTLVNKSNVSRSIGLQMTGDVFVGDSATTAYAFLPGTGFVRTTSSSSLPYPVVLAGSAIPDYFETYDSVETPGMVARNTLRSQDATAPDFLAIYDWYYENYALMWLPDGFSQDQMNQIQNMVWALCWNQRSLSAGSARKIVTYYGIGAANAGWTYRNGSSAELDRALLAVQGPRSLSYNSAELSDVDIEPDPFDVTAYVYNLATDPGPYVLEDVTVSIYLPPGLELFSTAEKTQQEVGRVPLNTESEPVTWKVRATGDYCGELEYSVSASDPSGWQQNVTRKVMVPATRNGIFRSGWQLVSVPFSLNDPALDQAFRLNAGAFYARYWSPTTGQYIPVAQASPGSAFWLSVPSVSQGETLPFELPNDRAIVGEFQGGQLEEQYVSLQAGWNMVGNPFVYPIYLGQMMVYNPAASVNNTVSFAEAVKKSWIYGTLFSWNADAGSYDYLRDGKSLLLPWKGYWIRSKIPVQLVFRPGVFPGSDVNALPGGY